jgi:SnoaL-like domain
VTVTEPQQAPLALRTAMENRDLAAVVDAFAPDAVFHSPLTARLTFTGRDQIGALTKVLFDVFKDFHYIEELRGPDAAMLVFRSRVGGMDLEGVDRLRLRPDGKIAEMTVYFRPLPAAAVALRLIGTGLGRHTSPARGALISVLTRPLTFMTESGDKMGVRLLRGSL